MINIADLRDPDDPAGRSYREVNADRIHGIPVGALVEIESSGVRLFVVYRGRDCDQTPLYWLSPDKNDTVKERESFANHGWHGGYAEYSLTIVTIDLKQPTQGHAHGITR